MFTRTPGRSSTGRGRRQRRGRASARPGTARTTPAAAGGGRTPAARTTAARWRADRRRVNVAADHGVSPSSPRKRRPSIALTPESVKSAHATARPRRAISAHESGQPARAQVLRAAGWSRSRRRRSTAWRPTRPDPGRRGPHLRGQGPAVEQPAHRPRQRRRGVEPSRRGVAGGGGGAARGEVLAGAADAGAAAEASGCRTS